MIYKGTTYLLTQFQGTQFCLAKTKTCSLIYFLSHWNPKLFYISLFFKNNCKQQQKGRWKKLHISTKTWDPQSGKFFNSICLLCKAEWVWRTLPCVCGIKCGQGSFLSSLPTPPTQTKNSAQKCSVMAVLFLSLMSAWAEGVGLIPLSSTSLPHTKVTQLWPYYHWK